MAEIQPAEIREGENDSDGVIQHLTSKIHEGAQKAKSLSSACIYRVPKDIRKLNESAYTPLLIAIGPLHRNDPHLQTPMQHLKMSYMNNLFCRITKEMENQEAEQKKILQDCVAAMKMSMEDAKNCYAEEVTVDVEMMLVDGCFILELLYKLKLAIFGPFEYLEETPDPIFARGLNRIAIEHDLLLLENQIPFLVLDKLFPLTLARIPNIPLAMEDFSLTDYVYLPYVHKLMTPRSVEGKSAKSGSTKTSCWPRDCIHMVLGNKINNSKPGEKVPRGEEVSRELKEVPKPSDFYHILHKLHHDFRPQRDQSEDQTGKGEPMQLLTLPSASELDYAGVKFVPGTGNDLFNVKFTEPASPYWWFRSARFEIPSIKVQRLTVSALRNFIAFEQCCPGVSQHFTHYAKLMDNLVNSDTDVQVLVKAEVIDNPSGASEAVINTFDKLGRGVTYLSSEYLFADTCNRATRYSKRFWPKNMAYVRRKYFASPWTFIAFCLAFVVFGVTIAQFIIGIL